MSGLCFLAAIGAPGRVAAQLLPLPDYKQIATIPVPGGLAGSFDISWVDSDNGRYYLADRTATAGTGRIDVIDTQTLKFLYTIPQDATGAGFVGTVPGSNVSGPNGVVAIPYLNQLYVGDGDSTVKVVDLTSKSIVATISTGGKKRADELAYDPADHIVMMANPDESTPYLTFISTDTQKILGTINYPGQSGLEQPVWDGQVNRFLISIPASGTSGGSVDRIDPIAMQVTERLFTSCSPSGLALGPFQRVMTACGQVIDGRTGQRLAFSQGQNGTTISGDEIWFNPGDNRYYFGATSVGVVDAETNAPLGFITNAGGHSIAVDSQTNRIFVPVTGVGVKVFARTAQ
jgi:DNA-binding beta-propeller fold protein YncE